jgi:hypothetical protein
MGTAATFGARERTQISAIFVQKTGRIEEVKE